jgi:hypothetical protein
MIGEIQDEESVAPSIRQVMGAKATTHALHLARKKVISLTEAYRVRLD